ncbi:MAG: UvrD-helicase domain-containing protein [Planctomycetaceae bacterium]
MAKLMVHRNILKSFHKLPSKVQKRVSELIEEFQHDPQSPAIGLHPLPGTMLDPKVRGVKKLPDGYRAIVIAPEKGDTYLLVNIDAHDKAYDWAKNKRFEVHGMTGVFQVFDAEEVQTVAQEAVPAQPTLPDYSLARLSDNELFEAGVPKPLVPAVKSIRSDDGLEALSAYLPPDCRDVLFGLAAGMTLQQAIDEMLGVVAGPAEVAPESPGDFTKIQETPNFDLVLVAGEEELKKMLEGTLEEWRIFLHPYQRKLVKWKTKGPMNITGSAGTGKTVALMHRAVHLAHQLEDESARILVTTFTTNLSVTIKHHMQRLAPDVAGHIEVTNLHALARTICNRAGWKGRIAEDEELAQIWDEVWLSYAEELPLSKEEMQLEYELVIDPNGIDDEETYLGTVRSGRPRISRKQRKAAWPVFRVFQRGLKKRNLLTFEGAIHEARLAVNQGNFTKYAHVLVDEVQDFSLEALRLIRAISPIDEGTPDPLCTVGDGHQRIYRTKIPMSRAGIDIRGRSRRLKINYRTSEQIRKFAQGILKGLEIDDLDGGVATTVGDHSVFKGPEPMVEKCKTEKAEGEAIVAWVQMLMADYGLATHEICVTPRKPKIVTALSSAGIATFELKPREEDPGSDEAGIRVGTMKRIKGLEFRAVAMACASTADPMNQLDEAEIRHRCERYVAATRAREHLLVTVRDK